MISIFSTFKIPLPKEAKEAEEKAAKAAEAEAPEEQAVAQLHWWVFLAPLTVVAVKGFNNM